MKTKNTVKPRGKTGKNRPMKAYNMAVTAEKTAEINMYGEVVSQYPVNFWTGEREPGEFIAVDEFLQDLDSLKNMDELTIHINSPGGDTDSGLAIYNRLKSLPAHITTVNDSGASSAASIIFQAGDVRRVYAASTLLAHGVSGMFCGYYNVEQLQDAITYMESRNKALLSVYAQATGKSVEEVQGLVGGDNFLTGQEIVDAGLADEVIDTDSGEEEEETQNILTNVMNRVRNTYLPTTNRAEPAAASQGADIDHSQGGKEDMEIKTVAELQEHFPELVAQIKQTAASEGKAQERKRIQGIEEIANMIPDTKLLNESKFGDGDTTAESLAFSIMQSQSKTGASFLQNLQADSVAANSVNASPVNPAKKEGEDEEEEEEGKEKEKEVKNFIASTLKAMGRGGAK